MSKDKHEPTADQIDMFLVETLIRVKQYGVAIQGVFYSSDDPDPGPNFMYTIGLAPHGKPELIEFGLPQQVGHHIMNDIAFRIINGEVELRPGDTIEQMVVDYPVKVVAVRDSWEHLTVANRLYGNPDGALPALQLVFPDLNGLFPWEPGCEFEDRFPVLGEWVDTGRVVTLSDEVPHQLRKKPADG